MPIKQRLTGMGMPVKLSNLSVGTVKGGLTAAGTNRATALTLTLDDNHVFTTVGSGTGCALIAGYGVGDTIRITNYGANALNIYPLVGGSISNGGAGIALSLTAGSVAELTNIDQTAQNWSALMTSTGGGGGGGTPANPTATASNTAVNGVLTTYMRSDAAPAVQLGSDTLFGLLKVDGTSITATAGVISAPTGGSGDVVGPASSTTNHVVFFNGATGKLIKDSGLTLSGTNTGDQTLPVGANPTATAGDTAVNGSAVTWMRSDAAPAVQKASSSVFGLAKVDGTTITASSGVISAVSQAMSGSTQSGTTYTFAIGDANNWVEFSNASAITVTIPTNASVAFPIWTTIDFAQAGTGVVTIVAAGGVTPLSAGTLFNTNGQNAVAGITKIATNTWRVYGNLA